MVRYRWPPQYDLRRLKQLDVASTYVQNFEAALSDENELYGVLLEDCWSTVKVIISDLLESIVGSVKRSRTNDFFFNVECEGNLEEFLKKFLE